MSFEEGPRRERSIGIKKVFPQEEKPDNFQIEKLEEEQNVPVVKTKGISYWTAFTNFIRTLLGVGCLALPIALKQSGWLAGLILIFLFGLLNAHCMLILVQSAHYLSRKKGGGRLEFGQVALEACTNSFDFLKKYGPAFKIVVNVSIIGLQMGVASVYYVFVTVHFKEVVEQYTNIRLSETVWLLLMFVPFVLVNCLRTLKVIGVLSGLGNIIMCGCLAIIFQHLIRQPHLSISNFPPVNSLDEMLTASGAILYAYEGLVVVLPLENKLKKPSQMLGVTGVVSTGMSTVTVIYALCGFLGLITYGEKVKGSIALNLPEDLIFSIVRGLLGLVIFTGFAIQQYVVIEVTLPAVKNYFLKLLNPPENSRKLQIFSSIIDFGHRVFLVFICMIVGITIPQLENIIPLVGITCGMLLAFVFPAVIEILVFLPTLIEKFKGSSKGKKWCLGTKITIMVIKDLFLTCLGMFGLVAGLQASIKDLVK
ncbi:hypothetical protein FO519_009404 [Halicephalobus sp. NKZ332]|nr:hypothetical protein FO519_009404 [Halicephalobus sp. NKZ332]